MNLIIISGRSGSGKTVALRALEDSDYYCIDNLPANLLPEIASQIGKHHQLLAVGVDARNMSGDLANFPRIIDELTARKIKPQVLYIDADENILLKRFSETRRRHPLTQTGISLRQAISEESKILEPISSRADLLVNTSDITPHQLREFIRKRVLERKDAGMDMMFMSFGFKHGIPKDADFVFDVRCLPNPYWEEDLRAFSGLDNAIIEYLNEKPTVMEYQWQLKTFLNTWIPSFESQNRSYMTIAIGCTGGRHRSVYMVEHLTETYSKQFPNTRSLHRDLKR